MDPQEYKELLAEINRLSQELTELGDREAVWTDEDRELWNTTDDAYKAAVERKREEDERRQKQAVQDRLESFKSPVVSRNVPVPASIVRKRDRTPYYPAQRLRAFRGDPDAAYDCGLWLKAVFQRDETSWDILSRRQPEWRQQVIGTPSAGGYTVPAPLAQAVIEVLNEVSVALQTADVMTMTANTLDVAKVVSGQTVYYPGEATAITPSEMAFGQVNLVAVKRATLTLISNELLADSIIPMAERVARRAAYEIAWNMDEEYLNGDGTGGSGSVTGLIPALAAAGTHTLGAGSTGWDSITLADFNATMGLLPDKFHMDNRLGWIMSRQFYASVVQQLMYAAGGNTTDNIQAGTGPQLMGHPIYFSARMPGDSAGNMACLFGNFEESVILGQRDSVTIASSSDYAFNEDVLAVRVTHRYDIQVHEPGNGGAGGYVGMALAAV